MSEHLIDDETMTDSRGIWHLWSALICNVPVQRRWYVELTQDRLKTTWGPYETREEVTKVSDFPKPKTETEELWEAIYEIERYSSQANPTPFVNQWKGMIRTKINNLEAKWKNQSINK